MYMYVVNQLPHCKPSLLRVHPHAHSAKRKELEILGEQVSLFKEAITAKDHVVVELTNQVFQLEHKGQIPTK